MTYGSQEDRSMITHSTRGVQQNMFSVQSTCFNLADLHVTVYSYLKTLLPSFNECCDKLLDGIRSQADGKTTVYMKQHLQEVTMNAVSKVRRTHTHAHTHTHTHTQTQTQTHTHMQVAFGSNFAETWKDKTLGLKRAKGNGKLTFLLSHTFKGMQRAYDGGFWFKVNHLTMKLV